MEALANLAFVSLQEPQALNWTILAVPRLSPCKLDLDRLNYPKQPFTHVLMSAALLLRLLKILQNLD